MILYVIRHAEAVDRNGNMQDEWRYLTEKGRTDAEKMSPSVFKNGPKPRLTITSPLVRAVQTAEIMAKNASRKNVVVASGLLAPGADICELIDYLKECRKAGRVMLVGHEPHLGSLVSNLLGVKDSVVLKKGACVALEFDPDKKEKPADFLWYKVPGKKRIMTLHKAFSTADLTGTDYTMIRAKSGRVVIRAGL